MHFRRLLESGSVITVMWLTYFCFLVLCGCMCYVYPKTVKYIVVAPLLGVGAGTAAWAASSMLVHDLLTNSPAYIYYLVGGVLVLEVIAFSEDE